MEFENRRGFVRAQVRLSANFRVLTSEEVGMVTEGMANTLFRGSDYPSLIDELKEQIDPGSEQEPLFRCFQMINNKLDFVIDQLSLAEHEERRVLNEVIEISGSGLKFRTNLPLHVGDHLKMDLIIPTTLQFRIEMISKVMRVEEDTRKDVPDPLRFVVAANYVAIEEESRDSIVKTVFTKHRKIIRMKKGDGKE